MEQTGEYRIAASRDAVWAGLNDPDVLARCIDGCQSMEQTADDRFNAKVKAKVGPVRATFDANLELHDVVPQESYTIRANVKGGPAGFAKGDARVRLSDDAEATWLHYTVNASVGGKLAQVGSRLIDGTARKMAEDFFACFGREVSGQDVGVREQVAAGDAPAGEEPAGQEPSTAREESRSGDRSHSEGSSHRGVRQYEGGGRWMIWTVAFVVLLLAMLFAL